MNETTHLPPIVPHLEAPANGVKSGQVKPEYHNPDDLTPVILTEAYINSPEFNWLAALEAAIAEEPRDGIANRLEQKAGDWPTCACGQACSKLPRHSDGSPKDVPLRAYGNDFYVHVMDRCWHNALEVFHRIESRTAELLAASRQPLPGGGV